MRGHESLDVMVDTTFTREKRNLYLPLHLPTSFYKYLQTHILCFQLQHRINRNDLPETGGRRMKKTLSGSTPQLVHHGVAALKFSEAEQARRAIVAKYLSPPPAALSAQDANKVSIPFN